MCTDVKCAVPEFSVLGFVLFLIFINDRPVGISSRIRVSADDCLLYRKRVTIKSTLVLQKDINSIFSWCSKWQMRIIINKTKFMTVPTTETTMCCVYTISGGLLETAKKFLTFFQFFYNLSWHELIDFQCK